MIDYVTIGVRDMGWGYVALYSIGGVACAVIVADSQNALGWRNWALITAMTIGMFLLLDWIGKGEQ